MSNLKGFLAANAKSSQNHKVVVSERFLDEQGEPIAWEIRALTADENNRLQDECQKLVPAQGKAGKRGQLIQQTDFKLYTEKLVAAAVVFPDLQDVELQDSYSVMGTKELLGTMLIAGEYNVLLEAVSSINGFDAESAIEAAKN